MSEINEQLKKLYSENIVQVKDKKTTIFKATKWFPGVRIDGVSIIEKTETINGKEYFGRLKIVNNGTETELLLRKGDMIIEFENFEGQTTVKTMNFFDFRKNQYRYLGDKNTYENKIGYILPYNTSISHILPYIKKEDEDTYLLNNFKKTKTLIKEGDIIYFEQDPSTNTYNNVSVCSTEKMKNGQLIRTENTECINEIIDYIDTNNNKFRKKTDGFKKAETILPFRLTQKEYRKLIYHLCDPNVVPLATSQKEEQSAVNRMNYCLLLNKVISQYFQQFPSSAETYLFFPEKIGNESSVSKYDKNPFPFHHYQLDDIQKFSYALSVIANNTDVINTASFKNKKSNFFYAMRPFIEKQEIFGETIENKVLPEKLNKLNSSKKLRIKEITSFIEKKPNFAKENQGKWANIIKEITDTSKFSDENWFSTVTAKTKEDKVNDEYIEEKISTAIGTEASKEFILHRDKFREWMLTSNNKNIKIAEEILKEQEETKNTIESKIEMFKINGSASLFIKIEQDKLASKAIGIAFAMCNYHRKCGLPVPEVSDNEISNIRNMSIKELNSKNLENIDYCSKFSIVWTEDKYRSCKYLDKILEKQVTDWQQENQQNADIVNDQNL